MIMNNIEEMQSLISKLNYYTKKYDEGVPEISDKEWDDMYFTLEELEKSTGIVMANSPTSSISYQVVNVLNKVEHNHKMLSLPKTKELKDCVKFCDGKNIVAMAKMDGLTCSLRYVNGKLVSAETRGNGIIGEDVLHNVQHIYNVPQTISYNDELIVDGEVICTYNNFEEFENIYKNPRNFASGSIRLLDAEESANRKLSFIVWEVIKGFEDINELHDKFIKISDLGFDFVPFLYLPSEMINEDKFKHVEILLKEWAKDSQYPIDGLVFKYDDIAYKNSLGETAHHLGGALAYKFYDDLYDTTLKDIEWGIGRSGILTPVAIFEPVEIDGTIIEKASLHNVSILKETLGMPWAGQPIKVFKANMIIPQIAEADLSPQDKLTTKFIEFPTTCPVCGDEATLTNNEGIEMLFCSNENCKGRLIEKLNYFAGKTGLDIHGISNNIITDLVDNGLLDCPADFFTLRSKREDWLRIKGYKDKTVDNILNNIDAVQPLQLERFICAIGIPQIGPVQAHALAEKFKSWEEFIYQVDEDYDFSVIDGIGESKSKSILEFCYVDADEVASRVFIDKYKGKSTSGTTLMGINVCITGSLNIFPNREALADKIIAYGGKVVTGVTNRTNYLINNDMESTSSKNNKAKQLKIPIISEEEFIKNFFEETNE